MFLNDMGIDPYEWFDNPLDSMPIAKDEPLTEHTNRYAPPDKLAELELEAKSMVEAEKNPRAEEEVADWFTEKPDESDEIEKEKSVHHKMYEIATSKYNPFSVGGSESIRDFQGGSENASRF